ncbi:MULTISPECIES: hypothetical protein [Thioclava]|uniref:hypothetical protein n=1 Tax=Thioclava TaxID=285107 RepID=UPI00098ABC60|nr:MULTISPECIES: hypothetical protein [Thioclava]OWY01003.1 hypothetical protein B6V76_16270 [Thioclava sp. IC9]OWY01091.1 hypothetical protein B6V75_15865 [Thioclava sp. F1Mire-8]OWY08688.1 hypothetical protein B6V74_12735 [Thioclava sp. F42-5]OWY11849.1 hypothetical protein B6V72_16110 [Thioclava sp. F34-6]OWY15855.1 hypothetical protein B6V73_15105 [Thioclava sp. JM3]
MSEIKRDEVLNYRPGPESELPLEEGEKVLAVFTADKKRYWTDHAVLAVIGAVLVSAVLFWLGKPDQVVIASFAIVVGMAARGLYFRSEAFARRWQLTDRRLIGPQGKQVMLLQIDAVRSLMGDVQVVTKSGDKHLIRHLADAGPVVREIESARAARKLVAK